jgi:hypothetical protein
MKLGMAWPASCHWQGLLMFVMLLEVPSRFLSVAGARRPPKRGGTVSRRGVFVGFPQ